MILYFNCPLAYFVPLLPPTCRDGGLNPTFTWCLEFASMWCRFPLGISVSSCRYAVRLIAEFTQSSNTGVLYYTFCCKVLGSLYCIVIRVSKIEQILGLSLFTYSPILNHFCSKLLSLLSRIVGAFCSTLSCLPIV